MALDDEKVQAEFLKDIPKPQMSPNEVKEQCLGGKILKNTIDKRKCVSPCTKDIMPPHPDAPHPPNEARIAQSPLGPGSDGSILPDSDNGPTDLDDN